MEDSKVVFWEKRMKITSGTKNKNGDAEEAIRGHRSKILPFDDALVDSNIVNEIVKPIKIDLEGH